MAKFLRVYVTRTESTELYVSVPDDFDKADLMGEKYRPEIGRIEADQYAWGELKAVEK